MNQASCLCGSLRWEISAEPFQAYNCHCKMCRKAHGSAFGTYWFLQSDQLHWISDTAALTSYQSSQSLTRCFCSTCGSVAPCASSKGDVALSLAGCHDYGKRSDCDIFVSHKAPWFDLAGDLPQFDDYPPESGLHRVEEEPLSQAPEGPLIHDD